MPDTHCPKCNHVLTVWCCDHWSEDGFYVVCPNCESKLAIEVTIVEYSYRASLIEEDEDGS